MDTAPPGAYGGAMTKTAATTRSVNAALRAAGITIYKRPPVQRTHRGQIVQSTGYYGTKVQKWSDTEVRVIPEVKVSSYSTPQRIEQARHTAYAKHVAALSGFTCRVDTTFGFGLIVSAA